MIVEGFHGTTEEFAHRIIDEREFIFYSDKPDWLGPGAYFFQDAPVRAWSYAENRVVPKHGGKPAVIRAKINIEDCLDLLDVNDLTFVYRVYERYLEEASAYKTKIKSQKRPVLERFDGKKFMMFCLDPQEKFSGYNLLDDEVIWRSIEQAKEHEVFYKAVRAPFIEGREIYEFSYFYSHHHIQIVVLDKEIGVLPDGSLSAIQDVEKVEPSYLEEAYRMSEYYELPID